MKNSILFIILSLIFVSCEFEGKDNSSVHYNIKCYSGGKLIYDNIVSEIDRIGYGDYYIYETKTSNEIVINADCIFYVEENKNDL